MAVRLEPVFLANVLLHVWDEDTVEAFPFVSKSCGTALRTLRINPPATDTDPALSLRFFPNINTIVVRDSCDLEDVDSLPDTVTAVVVLSPSPVRLTRGLLRYADRVVEIRGCWPDDEHAAKFACFPNLQRLTIDNLPCEVILPAHRLKRLTVRSNQKDVDEFAALPLHCAEQIVLVYHWPEAFAKAKARQLPPHVRVFCCDLGEGVTPADFYTVPAWGHITLTPAFGVDELRAFNEVLPIPYNDIEMTFGTPCAACDVSFLTGVTRLDVSRLKRCTLAVPTSLVELRLDEQSRRVTVSGTENLTRLVVQNQSIRTTPCPRLEKLGWKGETLSESKLPFPVGDATSLSVLSLETTYVQRKFRLPTQLTSLRLAVFGEVFDSALLTPLTHLQELGIRVNSAADPLDLSGLTTLTCLGARGLPVLQPPTSLVEYTVELQSDTDFSPLTHLTSLSLSLEASVKVTFPTGLKELTIDGGGLGESNIGDVALESLNARCAYPLTRGDLEKLPKTLKRIYGNFEPESLEEHLGEIFPLLCQSEEEDD